MPLIAKDSQKEFKPLDSGTHIARVCSIIHLGTRTENIKGVDVTRNRIYITFEVPTKLKDDGTPFTIGQEFTLSMNKQGNLLPFIESMLGRQMTKDETREFDVFTLVGKTAMLNVIHTAPNAEGNVYANIKSVSPLPEGMTCPEAVITPFMFDYEENFSAEYVLGLNEKSLIRKRIEVSEEWKAKDIKIDPATGLEKF